MRETTSGMSPLGDAASRAEIDSAIESLSRADKLRLKKVANLYVHKLGRLARGLGADDLLQAAVIRTLEGKRQWYKGRVDFVRHLAEAMRSIASHWGEAMPAQEFVESTLANDPSDPTSSLDSAQSPRPNPEQEAIIQESLNEIYAVFEDDDEVWQLILHHAEGKRGAEIRNEMGITELQYQAAFKRMQRRVAKYISTRPNHE